MNVWLLHGILAFVAWGVLSPAATATSILYRRIRPRNRDGDGDHPDGEGDGDGGDATTNDTDEISSSSRKITNTLWIRIHRYMYETVLLLTWIVFFIAVGNTRPGHHFISSSPSPSSTIASSSSSQSETITSLPKPPHKIVGLLIFISTFVLWGLGRVAMPPKNKRTKKSKTYNNNDHYQQRPEDQKKIMAGETTALLMNPPVESRRHDVEIQQQQQQPQTTSSKSSLFVCSSAVHRILGLIVAIAALWEIWSGMVLFFHHRSESKSELDGKDIVPAGNDRHNEADMYIRFLFIWYGAVLLVLSVTVVFSTRW